MEIIPVIAFLSLAGAVYLLRKGIIDGKKDLQKEEEEDQIDEFSPEQLDFDENLKMVRLYKEFRDIE